MGGSVGSCAHAGGDFLIIRAPQIFTVKLDPLKAAGGSLRTSRGPSCFVSFSAFCPKESRKVGTEACEASVRRQSRGQDGSNAPKGTDKSADESRAKRGEGRSAYRQQPAAAVGQAPRDRRNGTKMRGHQATAHRRIPWRLRVA